MITEDRNYEKQTCITLHRGGGSPEQSQEVVSGRQFVGNYEQSSARRAKPRFRPQARALAFRAKGGEPARAAFTMAEILLSLTIIGVVAAITLPSLTGNINERTWNTQRKALYARFSQAIALMPALNGYANTETFVTDGLAKVLKINNICDSEHLEDCGLVSKITTLNGNNFSMATKMSELNETMLSVSYIGSASEVYSYNQADYEAAAFETQNGESIVVYYYPNCVSQLAETSTFYIPPKICANFIYDLNGNKGPNTVGKDIGVITTLYSTDSLVVSPYPAMSDAGEAKHKEALSLCSKYDESYRVPNMDELASMFVNKKLFDMNGLYWSSNLATHSSGKIVAIDTSFKVATRGYLDREAFSRRVRCVKR